MEEIIMKIFYGTKPKFTDKDKGMFSHGKYECKKLLTKPNGEPVGISQNQDPDFPIWKVQHGYSCVVFATYDEALAYCKGKFSDVD